MIHAEADNDAGRRISVRSAICVPLIWGKDAFGVMTVTSPRAHAFTDADVATLSRLADSLSLGARASPAGPR